MRGEPEDVNSLEPLWLELHHHHQRVGPQSGAFTDDETSWAVRSASYREWLAEPGSFLILARAGDELVGYAMVRVTETDAFLKDAWRVPDRMAEIETMLVTESARGLGLGKRMLDEIDAELERQGITEVVVGLIPGNDGAERLYRSRGFTSRWLELARGDWSKG